MPDGKAFSIDLGRLKSREKDRSPQAIEKAERAGEELGFVARDGQKRRGRKPSPRTGRFMPRSCPVSRKRLPMKRNAEACSKAC